MKKCISFVIVFVLLISVAACGGGDNTPANTFARNEIVASSVPEATENPTEPVKAPTEEPTTEPTNDEKAAEEWNYSAPEELGNDLTSFNVEIEGDVYRLPAPLSAFFDNGWEITEEGLGVIAEYELGFISVDLVRNDTTFEGVQLEIYDDNVVNVENCIVVGIIAKRYSFWGESDEISVVLPGGITIGTSKDEVESAYRSLFDSDTLAMRPVNDDDTILYEYIGWYGRNIQIYISKETTLVYNIAMQNDRR